MKIKTLNYFINCETAQEVKNLYKTLAKQNHPDLGGDEEIMKEINEEFHLILKSLKLSGFSNIRKEGEGEEKEEIKEYPYIYNFELESLLQAKIISLLILAQQSDIKISVLGSWIWVEGDTKPIKEELKNIGMSWNRVRGCWCFNGTGKRSGRSKLSLDGLKQEFNAVTIKTQYALSA